MLESFMNGWTVEYRNMFSKEKLVILVCLVDKSHVVCGHYSVNINRSSIENKRVLYLIVLVKRKTDLHNIMIA